MIYKCVVNTTLLMLTNHHSGVMALLLFAEDHQISYDGYKSSLRNTGIGFGGYRA